jgi:uncharacterized protein YbbC (DUF1343 family)
MARGKYKSVLNHYLKSKTIKFIFIFLIFTQLYITSSISDTIVKPGVDNFIESDYSDLAGKRIMLFTNSTGRSFRGELTAELFAQSDEINLVGIITPEHGFFASIPAGEKVSNEKLFDVPVHSLYGEIRQPGSRLLSTCDAIVIDIQDIGVRSYTFISTTFKIMQAAAENNKPVYILDRPNPIGADIIDGNVLEKGKESFVGIVPIAYIHGMTLGELAMMINEEGWLNEGLPKNLKCNLTIIPMIGYKREMAWEDTGLMWFPTSPNVPTVNSARGLAMLGIFGELGIISIGIGTTTPFQLVGSPDFKWQEIRQNLEGKYLNGISLTATRFSPTFGMNSGKTVKGVFLNFNHSEKINPFSAGIELFLAIKKVHPEIFNIKAIKDNSKSMFIKVTGTSSLFNAFFNDIPDENVFKIANSSKDDFLQLREKYLIYK